MGASRVDLVAAFIATLVSGAAAGALLARGATRRRPHQLLWGISLALFAAGSFGLLWGAATAWTPAVFRTYYLAGGVLTVPFLGLGSVWLLSPKTAKGLTVIVIAFSAVATVVVLTAATKGPLPAGVPEGKELFERPPRTFAVIGNAAGSLLVMAGTGWSIARAVVRRRAGLATKLDGRILQANLLVTFGVVCAASGGVLLFLGDAASKAVPLAVAAILILAGYLRSTAGAPARVGYGVPLVVGVRGVAAKPGSELHGLLTALPGVELRTPDPEES